MALKTQKLQGEPKLPQKVVAYSIFIIDFGLLVFVDRPRHEI